ncbi:hypothetical protein EYC84_002464 [Monilinia fructicola]|uniref:Aquaporin n=1 Tax=Monilinia fructicola TaxID=38448 RepID=A0A5M9JNZ5_MONFR|nr:hypothetical protein EYC84_002464 [Monilinia fructicola]
MIDDQKKGDSKKKSNRLGRNEDDRGYGHQQQERGGEGATGLIENDSDNMILDHNGTPLAERDNPMDDWRSPQDDGEDALGEQNRTRLSDVEEHPSGSTLAHHATTQSEDFGNDENDGELDLERGDKIEDDEWSLSNNDSGSHWYSHQSRSSNIRKYVRQLSILKLAWGLGITVGIYIAGGISGAHLNPAISLMLCIYRGFPLRKAFIYILAQIMGGFLAGLIAYGIYQDAIAQYNSSGGILSNGQVVNLLEGGTGTSFYTQPESFASPASSFFNEFVATGILACAILALGDDSNAHQELVCTH